VAACYTRPLWGTMQTTRSIGLTREPHPATPIDWRWLTGHSQSSQRKPTPPLRMARRSFLTPFFIIILNIDIKKKKKLLQKNIYQIE
jgi:hypothetical protein